MTAAERASIWLNPPKFWSATKDMPEEEVDQLVEYLMLLAEQRDIDGLMKFEFISIFDPDTGRAA
jgi:cytochrome c1